MPKRKAEYQLNPDNVDQSANLDDDDDGPQATADEIAARPPLRARRRLGAADVTKPAPDSTTDAGPPTSEDSATPTKPSFPFTFTVPPTENKTETGTDKPTFSFTSTPTSFTFPTLTSENKDSESKPTFSFLNPENKIEGESKTETSTFSFLSGDKKDSENKSESEPKPFFLTPITSDFKWSSDTQTNPFLEDDSAKKDSPFSSSAPFSTPSTFQSAVVSATNSFLKPINSNEPLVFLPTDAVPSISSSTKPKATEQVTTTGEENETKIYSATVKLYQLVEQVKQTESHSESAASDFGKKEESKENEEKKETTGEETKTGEETAVPAAVTGETATTGETSETKVVENGTSEKKDTERVWSERGIGDIKLNVLNDDSSKSRIIIRRDKTHQLIVNMPIFNNITTDCPSDTTFKVIGFNLTSDKSAIPECYLVRFRSAKDQSDFVEHLNNCKSKAKPLDNKN